MMSAELRHVPVLRDRVIALLAPALSNPGSVLVDATVGLGGHAELALQTFPALTLIGLDATSQRSPTPGNDLGHSESE